MSEKPRSNGARSAPKPSLASTASRKFSKRQPSKNDKQKRGGATAKRKNQESGSTRYYTGTDADSSDEEDGGVSREQPQMPEVSCFEHCVCCSVFKEILIIYCFAHIICLNFHTCHFSLPNF